MEHNFQRINLRHKTSLYFTKKMLCCCLLFIFFCFASAAQAGVVKSKGVPRVVDGPQGEVVVTSVLDDAGTPVNKYEGSSYEPAHAPTKATATPKEPDVNDIEYKSSNLNPEDTVQQPKNSYSTLIIIALLVLVVGLAIVFALNKKKDK